ncbi:MAG: DNA-directed RNA polymerase subunit alpha [Chloroflexi bacterium]|nr:DNA-directed RNA polymerase subunit alpha [Chloroflexota bacterium]
MLSFVLPKVECEASSQNYCHFVIGPLESGYGITLGNALRRALLSSLPGAAVTSMRISGVYHEFSTIPHVKEDTTLLILNVKRLRFTSDSDKPETVRIEVRGEGLVTGADIICPPGVEVINPDRLLLTADSSEADLDIEMTVERGRGYLSAEERDKDKVALGEIPVDAIFSPIRRVNYDVERARIGHQSGYDELLLDIWTDGTITPEEALSQGAHLLVQHFVLISGMEPTLPEEMPEAEEGIPSALYDQDIDALDLNVRVYNSLRRAGITTVGEVLEKLGEGDDELLSIRNFGEKSLDELRERLLALGLLLSGEPDEEGEEEEETGPEAEEIEGAGTAPEAKEEPVPLAEAAQEAEEEEVETPPSEPEPEAVEEEEEAEEVEAAAEAEEEAEEEGEVRLNAELAAALRRAMMRGGEGS